MVPQNHNNGICTIFSTCDRKSIWVQGTEFSKLKQSKINYVTAHALAPLWRIFFCCYWPSWSKIVVKEITGVPPYACLRWRSARHEAVSKEGWSLALIELDLSLSPIVGWSSSYCNCAQLPKIENWSSKGTFKLWEYGLYAVLLDVWPVSLGYLEKSCLDSKY